MPNSVAPSKFRKSSARSSKTQAPKPAGTYHQHRERQRRRILDAATKLFDDQGIDRTTMAEVVVASGVRASTLYEYFSSKDDVVWAIFSQILECDAANAKKAVDRADTGLARITALLEYMASELSSNPSKVRFMAQFDAMYARDWPVERLLTLEGQIHEGGFEVFKVMIREGIADGSLRADLDPEITLHAVINAIIGSQRRLASLGRKVELEYGQPIDRLFQETIRIIVFGLRAVDPPTVSLPANTATAAKRTRRKRRP